MWLYQYSDEYYRVGFIASGRWVNIESYKSSDDAARRVNYLNGGQGYGYFECKEADAEAEVRATLEAKP